MAKDVEPTEKLALHPIDIGELLSKLRLGIGQTAELCGVSIRQLSYWTDKGIVKPVDEDRSRSYDYTAIERVSLIKQALDQGYSLEGAVAEADGALQKRDDEQRQIEEMSESNLERLILEKADQLQEIAERIKRQVRTYRISGDLAHAAASLSGVDRLIGFFEANPYTINTARQIALRLGSEVDHIERELELLEDKKFIQRIPYPGADVYRYIPQRRR
jgi:DNA-binding transcriptional MerR regulator